MPRWIVHDLFSKIPECQGYLALGVAFAQFVAVKCDEDPFDQVTLEADLRDTSCSQEVLRWFLRLFQSDQLRSVSRPMGGGPITKISTTHWQVDDAVARVLTSRYCRANPYLPTATPDSWIFVDEADFLRLWQEHTDEVLGSDVKPRRTRARRSASERPIPANDTTERLSMLSLHDVEEVVGLGSSTIYKLIIEGRFPAQIKVNSRSLWRRADVEQWITKLG